MSGEVFTINNSLIINVDIDSRTYEMELDTAALVSLISEKIYRAKFSKIKLHKCNTNARLHKHSVNEYLAIGSLTLTAC